MKKSAIILAALLTVAAFTGSAVAVSDSTADLLKKESAAMDKVQKTDQGLKDKKTEKAKKIKESADKVKGDVGQVKDMGKKTADDLKAFGK